jgi:hypothetical protein
LDLAHPSRSVGTPRGISTTRVFLSSHGGDKEKQTELQKEEESHSHLPANPNEKPSLWERTKRFTKETIDHYWKGTKLFYYETKTTIGILNQLTKGKTLTRRERRQLVRTTTDMFRLIPFLVFVIVPFMEFLLPVALKIFPNMLPSTFEDTLKKVKTKNENKNKNMEKYEKKKRKRRALFAQEKMRTFFFFFVFLKFVVFAGRSIEEEIEGKNRSCKILAGYSRRVEQQKELLGGRCHSIQ